MSPLTSRPVELHVDLEAPTVRLSEPDDTTRCVVVVTAPAGATAQSHGHRLGHLLVTAGVGTSEDGTSAQLSGDALAFRAAGEVDDAWIERFTLLAGAAPGSAPLGGKGALRCAVLWPGSGAAARTARG